MTIDWTTVHAGDPDPTPRIPEGEPICRTILADQEASAAIRDGLPAELVALLGYGAVFFCSREPHDVDTPHVAGNGEIVCALWREGHGGGLPLQPEIARPS